jgi:hypothetical protein
MIRPLPAAAAAATAICVNAFTQCWRGWVSPGLALANQSHHPRSSLPVIAPCLVAISGGAATTKPLTEP